MNGDGVAEFTFQVRTSSGTNTLGDPVTWTSLEMRARAGAGYIASGHYALFQPSPQDSVIGPPPITPLVWSDLTSVGTIYDAYIASYRSDGVWWGPFAGLNNQYIGVRFSVSNNFYYGWIRLITGSSGPRIQGWAYVTAPNTGIKAGHVRTGLITTAVVNWPIPPAITRAPQNQTVLVNNTTTLFVTTSGSGPLTFQWNKDGVAIAAATNATLTLRNLQTSDTGVYGVTVSNSLGSANASATLSVIIPPVNWRAQSILWQNTQSGLRGVRLLNWVTNENVVSLSFPEGQLELSAWMGLGNLAPEWDIATAADFNADGQTDVLWQNTRTGQRGFWIMNQITNRQWVALTTAGTQWSIVASGDFNADTKTDIVWQNSRTGQRLVWLMNGTQKASEAVFGTLGSAWQVVGAADFNADGRSDMLFENTSTGQRGSLLTTVTTNGLRWGGWVAFGSLAPQWHIGGTGDFNADGKADIIWENRSSGARGLWIIDSTNRAWVALPAEQKQWQIRNR
jgi:hypothetical protein